jgi:hypothetical protein
MTTYPNSSEGTRYEVFASSRDSWVVRDHATDPTPEDGRRGIVYRADAVERDDGRRAFKSVYGNAGITHYLFASHKAAARFAARLNAAEEAAQR